MPSTQFPRNCCAVAHCPYTRCNGKSSQTIGNLHVLSTSVVIIKAIRLAPSSGFRGGAARLNAKF